MDDSSEARSQEDKTPPEMSRKRTVKTRAQVEALEKFYEDHKYPTEAMKEQLAEAIGLTDKQVSGWFCHRRLKDKRLLNGEANANGRRDRSNTILQDKLLNGEANANGRQDRSSAILQDRGSGHKQDSCGSTKQGDDRNFDLREVESRRLTTQEHFATDLNYELGSRYTGNPDLSDDTSSGSSSSLRNMSVPSDKDPFNTASSRYQMQVVPIELKGVKPRTGPSGYLKVKRVENPSIAAVKRQLGRQYREDGPPLGVAFDPLPPGAFESLNQDPKNDSYYAPEQDLRRSQDIPVVHKNHQPGIVYGYNSMSSSHNLDTDGSRFKTMRGSDHSENHIRQRFEQKSSTLNYGEFYPGRSSSVDIHDGPKRGNPVYDNKDTHQRVKRGVGMMKVGSVPGQNRGSRGVMIHREQKEIRPQNYNDIQVKAVPAERFEYKPSSLTSKGEASHGFLDKGPPRRMGKETKLFGQRISRNDDSDSVYLKGPPKREVQAAKRIKKEPPQEYFRQPSLNEVPAWTNPANQVPRSAAELPSSFSEDDDETADSTSAEE